MSLAFGVVGRRSLSLETSGPTSRPWVGVCQPPKRHGRARPNPPRDTITRSTSAGAQCPKALETLGVNWQCSVGPAVLASGWSFHVMQYLCCQLEAPPQFRVSPRVGVGPQALGRVGVRHVDLEALTESTRSGKPQSAGRETPPAPRCGPMALGAAVRSCNRLSNRADESERLRWLHFAVPSLRAGSPTLPRRTDRPRGVSMAIGFSPLAATKFPTGGHHFSPLVAIGSPQWWPSFLPTWAAGFRSGASLLCRRLLARVGSCPARR